MACGQVRQVALGRSAGAPRCGGCVRRARAAERTAILHTHAATVVASWLGVDQAAVRVVVERAAPGFRQARWLVDALDDPAVLQASTMAPAVVDRLVAGLVELGVEGISAPCCHRCGRREWLNQRVGGLRTCAPCGRALRTERCGGCGRNRPVRARRANGTALCSGCAPRRREPCGRCSNARVLVRRLDDGTGLCKSCNRTFAVCTVCGHQRHCNGIAAGVPRCDPCASSPIVCSWCGRIAPRVSAQWAAGPVCSTCRYRGLEAKAICAGCSQWRRPDPRHPSGRCSDCVGLPAFNICSTCGVEDRIYRSGRCTRCTMLHYFDTLIESAVVDLTALRAAIAASDRPRAVLRWLQLPFVADTISQMACGDVCVDHDALGALGDNIAVNRVRAALVTAGLLPERNEPLARLERWISDQLDTMTIAEDRRAVEAFATWHVLRRARRRAERTETRNTQHGRAAIARAVEFLAFLRAHSCGLATCTQADLELWLAGPRSRRGVHDFVKWAHRHRLCEELVVPPTYQPWPARQLSPDQLEAIVDRLLIDTDMAISDRVAGLFIACYAQTPARLVRLTTDHVTIDGERVSVRFGRDDIELPPPIATVVTELIRTWRGRSAIKPDNQRWLFPGSLPGRALDSEALAQRLRRLGIGALAVRTTSLLDLATDVPATILADLLGLYPGTATRWMQAAGGTWTAYAAARVRQARV